MGVPPSGSRPTDGSVADAIPNAVLYERLMLRSAFQSLFWSIMLTRKRKGRVTLGELADDLGVSKSYISRSFSSPPNWRIDKLADMADALGVDLIVEARDRANPRLIHTPSGSRRHRQRAASAIEARKTRSVGDESAESLVPHFHNLVREAFEAQEAFDMWDEGVTFGAFGQRREVDLETVVREWDEAKAELVRFVLENGDALAMGAPK